MAFSSSAPTSSSRTDFWGSVSPGLLQALASVTTNDGIKEMTQNPTEPATLRSMYKAACDLSEQGDHLAAAEILNEVLKQNQKVFGLDHTETLAAMSGLASERFMLDQYAECEDLYRKLKELYDKKDAVDSAWSMMYNLSNVLVKQGKYEEADTILRKLLPLLRTREGTGVAQAFPQQEIGTLTLLMVAAGRQGRRAEADDFYSQGLHVAETMTNPEKDEEITTLKTYHAQLAI
jgi:tetratricopeptide (TPR) repeat protein